MRLMEAGSVECAGFLQALRRRGTIPDPAVEATVRAILEDVRTRGDAALFDHAARLDGARLTRDTIAVTDAERETAVASIEPDVREALALAARRIETFHRRQRRESWFVEEEGTGLLGQLVRPLARVGLYVPGGSAAYPSSVLMNAIPAKVAGVPEIALCTPVGKDGVVPPAVLAAADLVGVREIYKVGGAQAIGALAYGTASVPPVDKIVGPGNVYVATAKRLVFGLVGIDMVAGPSEVLVSPALAEAVRTEVERQLALLPRRQIAERAVGEYGAVIQVADLSAAVGLANAIAPEHLELVVADPWALLPAVRHAGAVFLGRHTPEVAGDYLAGPNHVLPTGGTARFSSPLSVDDFQTRSSLLSLTPAALARWKEPIARLAALEGLEAHARSITIRMEEV
ncbi:MAG: histidinol dehydrogenase [candidate division NC10 bacterium]|nr:histidinol dehydrogenase [candidate division NC10 bacterium]